MHLQHTQPSANLREWLSDQVLMGFQASAQAAGKIRFLGGLVAGRGLHDLLRRPAVRRGEQRYQGSTRQAGYTTSPSAFPFGFNLPGFFLVLCVRTPAVPALPMGESVGGKLLTLSGAGYQG